MKLMPHNWHPDQVCKFGCLFYCPCPDGCNGCDADFTDLKLLGDCRMPESDDCALNEQRRLKERDNANPESA